MNNIIINLNSNEIFNTTMNVINLIDVLKIQTENDEKKLVIVNKDIQKDDLNLIIEALTLYVNEDSKATILPQPIPIDKSFDEIIQYTWEKHIIKAINLRKGNDRIRYALKMGIICDYLCCILLNKFFCAYVGSWIIKNDNKVIESFFREEGMIVDE